MRALGLTLFAALAAGCTKETQANVATAALVTAAAVAETVANRAVTGACYAACAYGTVCNPDTGYCEAAPDGKTDCIDAPGEPPCREARSPDSSLLRSSDDADACGGICLENEECVMKHGDLTCEPKPTSHR